MLQIVLTARSPCTLDSIILPNTAIIKKNCIQNKNNNNLEKSSKLQRAIIGSDSTLNYLFFFAEACSQCVFKSYQLASTKPKVKNVIFRR